MWQLFAEFLSDVAPVDLSEPRDKKLVKALSTGEPRSYGVSSSGDPELFAIPARTWRESTQAAKSPFAEVVHKDQPLLIRHPTPNTLLPFPYPLYVEVRPMVVAYDFAVWMGSSHPPVPPKIPLIPKVPRAPPYSLVAAFEERFGEPFAKLPAPLRYLIEEFFLVRWDSCGPAQQREHAKQIDYQWDPAYNFEAEFWLALVARRSATQANKDKMLIAPTPDATAVDKQDTSLIRFDVELEMLEEEDAEVTALDHPERLAAINRIRLRWRNSDRHAAGLPEAPAVTAPTEAAGNALSSFPPSAKILRKPQLPYRVLRQWWVAEYLPLYPDPDKRPSRETQRDDAARHFEDHARPSEATMAHLRADKDTPGEWSYSGRRPEQET